MDIIKLKIENSYIKLPKIFYERERPDDVINPELIILNDALADDFNIDINYLKSTEGINVLCGNKVLSNTTPIAQAYGGHQFGHFTMLGDGRAVLLGEIENVDGEKYDLQLKGSGVTVFSRGGDGKAALGPMLREYIISEAMHGFGIKTTRSLAVVKTGEKVQREKELDGAVLTRIASSHIRIGTFEYALRFGSKADLKALADYTLERHFNEGNTTGSYDNPYIYLLNEVVKNQAELIAKWQLVGFIHGVMNTDNVAISGETIDYGPCAFMDTYNPDTVFSSIDTYGRYAYKNQPKIGAWNLARFAETLIPLIDNDVKRAIEIAELTIRKFSLIFDEAWTDGMRKKLGLFNKEESDKALIDRLLKIMFDNEVDYTNTFYYLTCGDLSSNNIKMFENNEFKEWVIMWKNRLKSQDKSEIEVRKLMKKNNPAIIPRNFKVEEALEAAVNKSEYSYVKKLINIVKNPYDYENINKEYIYIPKKWGCSYKTYCGT